MRLLLVKMPRHNFQRPYLEILLPLVRLRQTRMRVDQYARDVTA
jgi:hypothetical protein